MDPKILHSLQEPHAPTAGYPPNFQSTSRPKPSQDAGMFAKLKDITPNDGESKGNNVTWKMI